MTTLSKKTWAMQKENKRCLPKEGRPHAHGVCQKKRKRKEKRCIPKEGMPHACKGMSKKNADSSRLKIKGERVRRKEFIHESPKIVHTLAHLDQVV